MPVKGRTETVTALIDAGADPNQAAQFKEGCIFQSLMFTPLCVALLKGHKETADCLQKRGAVYDVFTAAYLTEYKNKQGATPRQMATRLRRPDSDRILESLG